jgi:hypothetical protein
VNRRFVFHIICKYLESEALRREIHEGLNVIENWNGANSFIFYGRSSDINTLLIQRVLAEPKHFRQMRKEDFRALTPLIYSHVTPYGTFRLDLTERILIEEAISA